MSERHARRSLPMFRRIIPLVVLGAGVLGCSKKDNPTNPGQNPADNTDPNAAYTIKFRGFEKGDKTEVVRARDASSTSKTVNSTQTQKDEFRYQYTETVLETPPDEPRPTK